MGRVGGLAGIICTCTVALLSVPASGAQYFLSGSDLYRDCKGDTFGQGMCLGLVVGAIDEWENWRANQRLPPCLPSAVDADQLRDVVVKYLEDHPELRDQTAWGLVVQAADREWNCK